MGSMRKLGTGLMVAGIIAIGLGLSVFSSLYKPVIFSGIVADGVGAVLSYLAIVKEGKNGKNKKI